MFHVVKFELNIPIFCFALCVLVSGEVHAQVIHAIVIADTDDRTIGQSVLQDKFLVTQILRNGIPSHKLSLKILTGSSVNSDDVITCFRNLRTNSNDTVLVYYSGNGRFSSSKASHVFTFSNGQELYRDEVRDAIAVHSPRLTVVLSDCCASYPREKHRSPITYSVTRSEVFSRGNASKVLNELFLNTYGVVDITSSKPGEISKCNQLGGFFTQAFFKVLSEFDDASLRWDAVFRMTRARTSQMYRSSGSSRTQVGYRDVSTRQLTQTAWSFESMYGQDVNRFLVGVNVCADCGRHIKSVIPNSAAQRAGLEAGDTNLAVSMAKTFKVHIT